MAAVTREEILKIARLARLSVEEDQLDSLTADMGRIIAFADAVSAARVGGDGTPAGEGGEPDDGCGEPVPLREDTAAPSFPREEILQNAGGGENGFFCLPKRKEGQP